MKKTEYEEFRKLLILLNARLRGDLSLLTDEALGVDKQQGSGESKSPTHMAELGSETFEQDFALSLATNEQETLQEVNDALERINKGTYGICEGCLKDGKSPAQSSIPKDRLRAIPYARRCVRCTRESENP